MGEASGLYTQVLTLDPAHADAHHLSGVLAMQIGRADHALDSLIAAVQLQPQNRQFHVALGFALSRLQRPADAERCFREALRLDPNHAASWSHLGDALAVQDRLDEAINAYHETLNRQPGHAETHNNLGNALQRLSRIDDAVDHYRQAVLVNPSYTLALNNLGAALYRLGQLDEAISSYRRALMADPDLGPTHENLGRALLRAGRYEEGWREHEQGRRMEGYRFDQPPWPGPGAGQGGVLFLHAEQGFGDTIQFCRYISQIPAGIRVILEVQQPLVSLLRTLSTRIEVMAVGDTVPAFDYHCPLLSLPAVLGTVDIPAEIPYLSADAGAVEQWRQRLSSLEGPKIGIAWAGSRTQSADRRRSLDPAQVAALTVGMDGVNFISLQPEPGERLADSPVHQAWTDLLTDFAETAALIEALDLVMAVDTAVIHLAGALGKPVWLLNRFDTCWRWLDGVTDSPWYPTLRQFRQSSAGDWDGVITAVREALQSEFPRQA